jgi:hypothetical protein
MRASGARGLRALLGVGIALTAAAAFAESSGVSIRPGGAGVEIVDVSTGAIISTVPVPGGVRDLLVRGSVMYVARGATGVVVVDVSDVRAPRVVRTVAEGHAIGRLEERWAQLRLYPVSGGRVLVYDTADPLRPIPDAGSAGAETASRPASRPSSQPSSPAGMVSTPIARAEWSTPLGVAPVPGRPVDLPRLSSWDGLSRVYFDVKPGWNLGCYYLSGGTIDLGVEHSFKAGFLIGGELSARLTACGQGIVARVRLGYGGEHFAASLMASSGYPYYFVYPQVGPRFRFGSYAGTYAEVWLYWDPMLLGPIPFEGGLKLSVPTAQDWRFLMTLAGDYLPVLGPYFLLGGQRTVHGSGHREAGVLSFGVGLMFSIIAYGIPGPMLHIGYEWRF